MMVMDLDTLLAQADPARQDPAPGADSAQAARLYSEITAGSRRRPRSARAVPVAAVAAAVAAIATGLVVVQPGSGGFAPAARPTARGPARPAATRPASLVADVLDNAAQSAARQAAQLPEPGQYFYIKQIDAKGGGPGSTACAKIIYQFWIARDGSGIERGTSPGCDIPQFTFRMRLSRKAGLGMGYFDWQGLPAQPAALKRAIARRLHDPASSAADMFLDAGMMLNADAPPQVRASLFRMMETLPGITDLGHMTDPLGRPGIGIGLVQHSGKPRRVTGDGITTLVPDTRISLMMIISPQTGAVLASADGLTRSPHGPGLRLSPSTNMVAGIVNSVTSTRPARNMLPPVPGK
jgi:hypothetical protein